MECKKEHMQYYLVKIYVLHVDLKRAVLLSNRMCTSCLFLKAVGVTSTLLSSDGRQRDVL